MTITTVPITCTFNDQNGNPIAGARVTAKLNKIEIYQGMLVADTATAVADANGVAVLNVWPNALGTQGSLYAITAISPATGGKFMDAMVSVPNSACNLHQILNIAPYPAIDAAQQALAGAQGALALVTEQIDIATTKAGEASASAGNASTSAANAAISASAASAQASNAAASAASALSIYVDTAAVQAAVSTSTTNATTSITQAGIATTKAGEASSSAIDAAASAATTASAIVAERTAVAILTNKELTSPDINGGTVDGAVIGGAVPAAGSFTTLNASGNSTLVNGTSFTTENATISRVVAKAGSSNQFDTSAIDFKTGAYADEGKVSIATAISGVLAERVGITSTGLAVTGGISATGALTTAGLKEDASGNLGLGVVPSAWSAGVYRAIELPNGVALGSFNVGLEPIMVLSSNAWYNGSTGNWIYKNSKQSALYAQNQGVHSWSIAPSGTAGDPISFTQAMTLDASGNLLVGQTSGGLANSGSFSYSAGTSAYGGAFNLNHSTSNTSTSGFINFNYNAGNIGSITQSGTTAVLYNTSSDARLKENITDSSDAASLIDALQVRQFDWKSDGSHQRYGFVAQELYEVAPEAVSKPQDPEEMMAVDYSKLVPMLVKEIQSLRQRLATAGI